MQPLTWTVSGSLTEAAAAAAVVVESLLRQPEVDACRARRRRRPEPGPDGASSEQPFAGPGAGGTMGTARVVTDAVGVSTSR